MAKYKTAVIGLGRVGATYPRERTHCHAYHKNKRTKLVAVCDIDRKKARKYARLYKAKYYIDYREMMRNEEIDIVSVCTPPKTHTSIIKNILKHKPTAILCEKSTPVQEMFVKELCFLHNVRLFINHFREFQSFYCRLKRSIKKMGRPHHIIFYYSKSLEEIGSHIFNLIHLLFGRLAKYSLKQCSSYWMFELDAIMERGRIRLTNNYCEFYRVRKSRRYPEYQELCRTKTEKIPRFRMEDTINHVLRHLR